ncbi:Uncharacterized protein PECH_002877 [Penicillium ucsense]|uniref:Proteasome assembly chaperone 4 n=2 Tax=Penicillium TaxID=5073 RepID=A0A8J8VWD1_9EURO|nr:uncharacterized protein N7539_002646 [Penicillium diatomitis]KAF7712627.1 Uncharacterized protein PECM_002461 [Penicillium ucsense]KAF7730232.1 Uncharacterized protein PECH_002877 [Penicillium ucsense]KAJ5491079.1 hypothetical protein N7539_002646 [Penicillium diatomitis]
MATAQSSMIPQLELLDPTTKPKELSFPLPRAFHTTGHVHLTVMKACTMVHLATSTPGESSGSFKPMGSFVYAMPDRTSPNQTLSTTLYTTPSSIEYTTRVAKILARRMQRPVYVGCSIDPNGLGQTVEEEMEGLKYIVDLIMENCNDAKPE